MNVKRKFTAFAAAFLLLLFATPSSAALEFETDTEVRDATYNTEPTQSLEAGVPDGIPEEMLETEGETTRAQFLTMLVNLANPELDTVQSTSFPDVPENAYYALQVSWAKANGIINGTAAGVLEPDTPLTRNEASVMAARLAKAMGCDAAPLSSRTLLACADAAQVPLYARRAVKWCMENGILTASEKGFEPKGTMNHKEAVDMILALGCWLQNNGPVVRTIPASAVVQATEQHAALQNRINAIAKKYGAVGLSIAYIKDGHVSDTFAYGEAVRGVSAMTADTKVRAASISKVLVGMAASLSAEEGTMTLDTELDTYLGFPIHKAQEGDHITVRSVLTHTSSLRAPEDVSRSYEGMKTRLMSSSATREVCSGNLENWLYNNYAFSALGLAVERANSCTMDELLGHYLYRPLSIDAAFRTGSVSDTKKLAVLYRADGSTGLSYQEMLKAIDDELPGTDGSGFAGGLTISAYDLGKIVALLAGDGKYEGAQYLSPSIVSTLESHGDKAVSGGFYQCQPLRLRANTYGQSRLFYHTGSAYGAYNLMCYNPDTGCGVVVLTSGASGKKDAAGIYAVCGEISNLLFAANP